MNIRLASILVAASLLAGCARGTVTLDGPPAQASGIPEKPGPVHVEVFQIESGSGADAIPAVISVEGTAAVLARRDGIITALDVQEGSSVKRGQVLAVFENDDSQMQLNQAELEVRRLQFEEKQFEASIKMNASELDRQLALAREGIVSQAEVERARFKLEVSEQELEKTRLATRQANSKVEGLKLEVEKAIVRSPMDGVITQRLARLGSNSIRNEKLFEVARLSPLEVRFQIPQTQLWRPQTGEMISLQATDSRRVRARISVTVPVADAGSSARTYVARLEPGSGLIPGAAVSVLRPSRGLNSSASISVPRAAFAADAILSKGSVGRILVMDNGICRERNVTINKLNGDMVEILSGLSQGGLVILSPPSSLKPGTPVTAG